MSWKKVSFLLAMATLALFIYFSYLVSKEKFTQMDFDLTVKFQDHISRGWDIPFSFLSLLGSAEITGLIWLTITLLILIKRYWLTFFSLSLFTISMGIEIFGKIFVLHPGPPFLFYRGVLDFNFPSQYVHTDYSYPSGHITRTSFLVIFLILWLNQKTSFTRRTLPQIGLFLFLVAMIISRIYLGEHWTTDVVGGLLLGGSLGTLSAITIPAKKVKL